MAKQLKSRPTGRLVNIIADTDSHYWVRSAEQNTTREPFTVAKSDTLWELYDLADEKPQMGDVVSGNGGGTAYRVLGVSDRQMIVAPRDQVSEGRWKDVKSGGIQVEMYLKPDTTLYVRELPDDYLKVIERP